MTQCWYSGGMEGVLVDWQLDTGKKKFLPRIGSPLLYLTDSLDPSLSAVSVTFKILGWSMLAYTISIYKEPINSTGD